jgi:hypothetical protein
MTHPSVWSKAVERIRAWLGARPKPETAPLPPIVRDPGDSPPIGVAWMEKNGTIYVRIRLEDEERIGDVNLTYTKRHPCYRQVIASLGGMKPGGARSVFGDWKPPTVPSKKS